jgi:hypothetical protein
VPDVPDPPDRPDRPDLPDLPHWPHRLHRPQRPDTSQEPVEVLGYGPIPAPLAREWIASTAVDTELGPQTQAWIRRLFTTPDGTRLVDMDTRHREFPAKLRRFIDLRDRRCRTPWCDAPIRHADHPLRAADGGPTNETNSQGLCEACNYAKEATGWRARARPGGLIETTTPTGHAYTSHPPPPIGSSSGSPNTAGSRTREQTNEPSGDSATAQSPLEARLRDLLASA